MYVINREFNKFEQKFVDSEKFIFGIHFILF